VTTISGLVCLYKCRGRVELEIQRSCTVWWFGEIVIRTIVGPEFSCFGSHKF